MHETPTTTQYHRHAERLTHAGFEPEQTAAIVEVQKEVATETLKEQIDSLVTKEYLAAHLAERFAAQDEKLIAMINTLFRQQDARIDERFRQQDEKFGAKLEQHSVAIAVLQNDMRLLKRITISILVGVILHFLSTLVQWSAPNLVERARAAIGLTEDAPVVQAVDAAQEAQAGREVRAAQDAHAAQEVQAGREVQAAQDVHVAQGAQGCREVQAVQETQAGRKVQAVQEDQACRGVQAVREVQAAQEAQADKGA